MFRKISRFALDRSSRWAVGLAICGGALLLGIASPVGAALSETAAAELAPARAAGEAVGLSAEEGAAAVRKHIDTQSAKHGSFWVYDTVANESLRLTWRSMHEEQYGLMDEQTYFASASFVDLDGSPVEVDVVLRGTDPEQLEVLEVTVRERGGEPRYEWVESDGYWQRSGEAAAD